MSHIRPMKDLRNTTEISDLCHKSGEPIYITKNGYGDLVVMSIGAFEKMKAKIELYEKLAEAEKQVKNHEELLDAETVFERLNNKYGKK